MHYTNALFNAEYIIIGRMCYERKGVFRAYSHLRRSALLLANNYSLKIVDFTFWQGSECASVEDPAIYDGNCEDFKTTWNK